MNEKQKKKNKIIGISIGILVVLLVVISSTYAYWQITKSQNGSNDIIAACLNIDMQSVDGTFALDPAWPISDTEGMNLTGYKFRVINNCPEDVAYVIGMDSLEVSGAKYLSYDSIKVSIDNNDAMVYGVQEDIEHIAEEDDNYVIRDSKKMATAIVKNGQPNEHIVKVWIKSDAPVEEQSKVFSGRIFITGGQKIENDKSLKQATADDCFTMNGTEIIGYDESCGESVVIPSTVKGEKVKTIDTNAFRSINRTMLDGSIVSTDSEGNTSSTDITSLENVDLSIYEISMIVFDEGDGIYIVHNNTDTVKSLVEGAQAADPTLEVYYDGVDTDQIVYKKDYIHQYLDVDTLNADGSPSNYAYMNYSVEKNMAIKSLDLSMAYNLEKIEEYAFSNITEEIYTNSEGFLDSEGNLNSELISLTSLTFGKNDNDLIIGNMAFAGIDVNDLTIYASHKLDVQDEWKETNGSIGIDFTRGAYVFSNIGNVTIKATSTETKYGIPWEKSNDGKMIIFYSDFGLANVDNIIFEEGITEVIAMGLLKNPVNISLPNGLKKIHDDAFTTLESNITIPSTVTSIGAEAFNGMESTNIITMQGRTNLDGMTLGDNWSGEAQISYSN